MNGLYMFAIFLQESTSSNNGQVATTRRGAIGRSEHLKKCMVSNSRIRNCISLQRATPVAPRNANCERRLMARAMKSA